ncbi:ABC transporter permease [Agaribacterium sp. ZY112]|uniref:ABC transporter permease n=1 Tax=Agaribacterium sp. ZY112 TaxID=3233574 RepID=UPI00352394E8
MLKNYLLIALRTIASNRLFSAINILGLALGLAACMLIMQFVNYERSYDTHWQNSDDIYRITRYYGGNDDHLATVAPPIKPLVESRFSDVEDITRLGISGNMPLSYGDKHFSIENLLWADQNVFDFFQLEFIAGDPTTALNRHSTLVMTETQAKRFFGKEDPIGKKLLMFGKFDIEVTGVIKDLPENTHLNFSMLASLVSVERAYPQAMKSWTNNSNYTYIKVKKGSDIAQLKDKFASLLGETNPDIADQKLILQAIKDIHLHSDLRFEMPGNGSYITIISFSAVALVILLIACINFMNLSTARATQRAKEVGMRKSVGASRLQLSIQFLGEACLLTAAAMLLACVLVELSLPWFANFVDSPLQNADLYTTKRIMQLIAFTLAVGCIAGSYPAFYLSHFNPIQALKGHATQSTTSIRLRKGLVLLQFAISICLIICTSIVVLQTNYARNIDPGYSRAQNLVLSTPYAVGLQDMLSVYKEMRARLSQHPGILSITHAGQAPASSLRNSVLFFPEDSDYSNDEEAKVLGVVSIGFNYIEHYDFKLIAGRSFSESHNDAYSRFANNDQPVGKINIIISRDSAKKLGYSPEQAIGKVLRENVNRTQQDSSLINHYTIIGVVEDVFFSSLLEEQQPMVYQLVEESSQSISIKIDAAHMQSALKAVDDTWRELLPNRAINRSFLDERFIAMYDSEEKQATMLSMFSGLAILIASLGLYGLATFSTNRRTKEIGVRKVLGASVQTIVLLLTKEFSVLVLLANFIAWPLSYYVMSLWLERFSHTITLSPIIFISASVFALVLAWLTVASQAAKAAMTRPTLSLRYE